uniref:Uncharacterized protein n=1 Tax=Hyaloperonospora arabidopsidis (strain Emoy2) TaxID=559515 RepID=M4B974_HYAAE
MKKWNRHDTSRLHGSVFVPHVRQEIRQMAPGPRSASQLFAPFAQLVGQLAAELARDYRLHADCRSKSGTESHSSACSIFHKTDAANFDWNRKLRQCRTTSRKRRPPQTRRRRNSQE